MLHGHAVFLHMAYFLISYTFCAHSPVMNIVTDDQTAHGKEMKMNKKIIVMAVLAATIICVGTGAVLAGHGPGGEFGGPPPGMEMGPGGFEGRMAQVLKLTETQQSQIKAVFDTERDLVKPLFDKMHESRKQLMSLAEATVFDEAAVRTIAQEQAATETELIVSHAQVRSKINGLLTQEQRELLKNLRPENR
jgi:Spy/CpxP family protein refolding chaperone